MSFLDDYLAEHAGPLLAEFAPGEAEAGYLIPPPMRVEMVTGYLPVPDEMLMDCGVIPDTRPKPVLTRRQRFARWRRHKTESTRLALAGRAYRLISGEDVPEPEEW